MSELKPHELLVRFPLDPDGTVAWHVELAAPGGVDGFGRARPWDIIGPLTPEQAEGYGINLDGLLDGLNAEALKDRDRLLAIARHLQAEVADREKQIADLTEALAERDAWIADLSKPAASMATTGAETA